LGRAEDLTVTEASVTEASVTEASVTEAWVYLLRCADGSLYCGWTVDVPRRLLSHRAGRGSRYTASRLPVTLALALPMPDRRSARREEARIKRLDRTAKLALLGAQVVSASAAASVSSRPGSRSLPAITSSAAKSRVRRPLFIEK